MDADLVHRIRLGGTYDESNYVHLATNEKTSLGLGW